MQTWTYPATFTPDNSGRVLVTFSDFPEAMTDGASQQEARANAADLLEEAVLSYLAEGLPVPPPRSARSGEADVDLEPVTAARAALAQAMAEGKITNTALAARLGKTEGAVRRLFRGDSVKMDTVLAALHVLGRRVALTSG